MRVVIMGCGRVGAALSTELDVSGHDVVVIDRDPSAFGRLPEGFAGRTVTGVGFDRDILDDAGLADADAFAAVSSGDNSNIIAARVARETYGIERVIARIYDAGRAAVYERLGIPTVATVPWATGRLVTYLTAGTSPVVWRDPSGSVSMVVIEPPAAWVASTVDGLGAALGGRVAAITRFGECRVPEPGHLVQADDLLHLTLPSATVDGIDEILERGPDDV